MAWTRLVIVLQLSWGIGLCVNTCDDCPPFVPCPEIPGCLLPKEPYEFVGNNLTLNCTIPSSNRSSDLYFAWKDEEPLPTEYQQVISPETLQLNMPILTDTPERFLVHCNASWTTNGKWSQQVLLEYPPSNMTDIQIVVDDWKNVTVTWNNPVRYYNWNNINLTVMWTAMSATHWYYCDEGNTTYCFVNEKSFKDSSEYLFNITVTNTMKNVTNMQSFKFITNHYAKPAPVELEFPVNRTSCCVFLQWYRKISAKSLSWPVAVNFNVTTSRNGQKVSIKTLEKNTTSICDLRPSKKYDFKIFVKPKVDGYWSNPTSFSVSMLEDKPDHGPIVTAGGFHAQECHNGRRTVLIFLRPPEEEHQTGPLTNYTLTYIPSDHGHNLTSEPPSSLLYDTAHLSCNIDYDVYISVNTRLGKSPHEHFLIPREGKVAQPMNILVSVNLTSTVVYLVDSSQHQPLNWTVFWCQGVVSFQTCQSEIQWVNVLGSQKSKTFDYKSSTIYGVSVTTVEGTSGITWTDCIYDVNRVPKGKPSIKSVDSRPNLGLTVSWLLQTCEDLTLITHYIIQYCIYNSTACENITVTSDHSQVIISSLQEDVLYSVRLKQVAVSGAEGKFSDPVIGRPHNSDLKPGQIVGIVFGCAIFLVIILTVFVQCFRFARRKWKEKETIELPRNPQIQGYTRHDDDPLVLPDRQDTFESAVSKTKANGYLHQTSTDSGQGSLPCVNTDSPGHSPTSQFHSEFEMVKEEGSLSGSVSKHNTADTPQIPGGYALLTINSNSGQSNGVQSSENETRDVSWDNSGGYSNDGNSDSLDPYVTAVDKEDKDEEDSSGSNSVSGSGSQPLTETEKGVKLMCSAEDGGSSRSATDHTTTVSQCKTGDGVTEVETFQPADHTNVMEVPAIKDNPDVGQDSGQISPEDEGIGSLQSDSFKSDIQGEIGTESDLNNFNTENQDGGNNMHICYKF